MQKGQKIDLTKDNGGLKHIMVGLGWDEAQKSGSEGGFLSRLFSQKVPDIDCDASAILCNKGGRFIDLVYYGHLKMSDGSIVHQGDNLTGEGEGDDEQIMVDLDRINSFVDKIVFVVNIYDATQRRQHFGMIRNAFIRLVDEDKKSEICRFNLSENYSGMEGLIVGELYRKDNTWKFSAIGQPVQNASHVDMIAAMYK